MTEDVAAVLAGSKPWAVECGDAIEMMNSLPPDSVDAIITSPPYERARLYLENGEDMGIARDTDAWVSWMVAVAHAARRICKGLCVFVVEGQTRDYRYSCSPFLLMADLHRAGFHLRKPPIYKRVGIPGSGGPDWLRNDYELCVCFTRGGKLPWSDPTSCGHPPKWQPGGEISHRTADGHRVNAKGKKDRKYRTQYREGKGRMTSIGVSGGKTEVQSYIPPDIANPGNVIECTAGGGTMGNRLCHENEAPFPEELVAFFVRSFCPPNGVCLDPFSGSGTTAAVAVRWKRRALGFDLRQSQVDLSRRRIQGETPDLFEGMVSTEDAAE